MAEVTDIKKATEAAASKEAVIKLSRTYDFEGEKIKEIDMSGLEEITANDMIKANKVLNNNGTVTVLPETNLEYTLIIAASDRAILVNSSLLAKFENKKINPTINNVRVIAHNTKMNIWMIFDKFKFIIPLMR